MEIKDGEERRETVWESVSPLSLISPLASSVRGKHVRDARSTREAPIACGELRRHCRRWRPLQNVHYVHTHSHTHAHTHTGDVTKRCDCPGRITSGRAHSAGERDWNTRAHAPTTHARCTPRVSSSFCLLFVLLALRELGTSREHRRFLCRPPTTRRTPGSRRQAASAYSASPVGLDGGTSGAGLEATTGGAGAASGA